MSVGLALFTMSCSTSDTLTSSQPETQPTQQLDTTTLVAPEISCASDVTLAAVGDFLDAYNDGESDLTERFFTTPERFQWYSERPQRLNDAAFDRSTLDAYLAMRHAEGDRLDLYGFDYNGYRAEDRTGHFSFVVSRSDGTTAMGKGAIDCDTGKIMVWSF